MHLSFSALVENKSIEISSALVVTSDDWFQAILSSLSGLYRTTSRPISTAHSLHPRTDAKIGSPGEKRFHWPSEIHANRASRPISTRPRPPSTRPAASRATSSGPSDLERPQRPQRPQRPRGRIFYIQGSRDLQGDRLQGARLQGARLQPSCQGTTTTRTTLPRTMPWASSCQPSGAHQLRVWFEQAEAQFTSRHHCGQHQVTLL